jgi:hypothetical protein
MAGTPEAIGPGRSVRRRGAPRRTVLGVRTVAGIAAGLPGPRNLLFPLDANRAHAHVGFVRGTADRWVQDISTTDTEGPHVVLDHGLPAAMNPCRPTHAVRPTPYESSSPPLPQGSGAAAEGADCDTDLH